MKILLGVDGSEFSQAAIRFLQHTHWELGTRVVVASVARVPVQTYSEVYVGVGAPVAEVLNAEREKCEEIVARAEADLRRAGLSTEARVVRGAPQEALVDLARTEGADLLVVGSHGRTGFNKLVMGSVATHVVTHAPCDVLVVKRRIPQ